MVRIFPYRIGPESYEKIFSVFYEVVGHNRNKTEFNKILFELLSPSERVMIVKRIAIVYLLLKEVDCEIIKKVLKVSFTTISKYRIMMESSHGIVPALKDIISIDKIALLFEQLFNDIFAPGVYRASWSAAWQRKFRLERKKETGL